MCSVGSYRQTHITQQEGLLLIKICQGNDLHQDPPFLVERGAIPKFEYCMKQFKYLNVLIE